MTDQGLIRVDAAQLMGMADHITTAHSRLTERFAGLTAELTGSLEQWSEGTGSREAFDAFKRAVDTTFADMFAAASRMPPLVTTAADEAMSHERARAAMWSA